MKKLIMCVAAVLSACALNAASVSWGVSDLFDDNYDSLVGTITLSSGSYSDTATISDGFAGGSFSGFTWGTDPFASDSAWTMTARVKDANGDMYEQVFNINLGTLDSNDYERSGSAAFGNMTVDLQATMIPNGTLDTTDLASAGWAKSSGVPEPTSGLLLALGGAMLALRRRRS